MRLSSWLRAAAAIALAALPARSARAQSDCAPGSLASYIALGAVGCRLGGLVARDFGAAPTDFRLDPSLVTLAPRVDAAAPGLAWLGFELNAPFGPFSITDAAGTLGAITRVTFAVDGTTVAGARASVLGAELAASGETSALAEAVASLYGSAARPTTVSFFERYLSASWMGTLASSLWCLDADIDAGGGLAPPPGGCGEGVDPLLFPAVGSDGRQFEIAGGLRVSSPSFDPTMPSSGVTARLDGVVGQYLVAAPDVSSVPEPATLALVATGLLATATVATRRRRTP